MSLINYYTLIVKNCLETNLQFFKFGMVLGLGNVFPKLIAKKGDDPVDLFVKFKMATKTAVKIIKCNIIASV